MLIMLMSCLLDSNDLNEKLGEVTDSAVEAEDVISFSISLSPSEVYTNDTIQATLDFIEGEALVTGITYEWHVTDGETLQDVVVQTGTDNTQ